MNVALIGEGKITESVASSLAAAGHDVYIGIKSDNAYISNQLFEEHENVFVTSIENAAIIGDVIMITSICDDVREVAYMLEDVRTKVIIDFASINFLRPGKYYNTAAAIKTITSSPHVVKVFNCAGYEGLLNEDRKDDAIKIFMAGDSRKGKEVAKIIVRDLGFNYCHDFGGDDSMNLLDEMAICWHKLAAKQRLDNTLAFKITKQ